MRITVILLLCIAFTAKAQLTSLQNIDAWAYQLQYTNPVGVAPDASFQLLVTDYSYDANNSGIYTAAEVLQMKTGGKKVVAYISIGEAENYRNYWQPAWVNNPPVWLGPENPDWPGNFKVKYWYPEWQNIIMNYVDTILSRGYDGIYMDIIDAYYYWQEENVQEPLADTLMIDFIAKIRQHVNTALGNTSFIIIPQNAEDIIDANNVTPALKDKYFNCINAVGVEDVFFTGDNDMNNAHVPDTYRIGLLEEFKNRGKRVFSIEYIDQGPKLSQYSIDAQNYNYVPYACTRALDMLCTQLMGVEEAPATSFFSYTNPTEGELVVNTTQSCTLSVTDITGHIIAIQITPAGTAIFTGLAPQLYLLTATTKGRQTTRKVFIR